MNVDDLWNAYVKQQLPAGAAGQATKALLEDVWKSGRARKEARQNLSEDCRPMGN